MSVVLVTDGERPHALAVARSLGRAGRRVCVASHRDCPAFRSRFVAERLHVANPAETPAAMARDILARLSTGDVELVVPVTELSLLPLAARRSEVERWARLALPAEEALEVALDKAATVALAQRLGVPVPPTRLLRRSGDLEEARRELRLPVVLKLARSVRWHEAALEAAPPVAYARSWEEAASWVERVRLPALCQELVVGEGVGLEGLYDRGRPLALFQHVRVRELPFSGGGSTCRRSEPLDPVLVSHARRLFGALGWTGVAMLEVKRGPLGPIAMEINGRFWGSLPLAVAAGVDFPRLLADLLVEGRRPEWPTYRIGVTCLDVGRDLEWSKALLRGTGVGLFTPPPKRRALDPIGDLLRGGRPDLWAPDDLPAMWSELAALAVNNVNSLRRSF